MFSKLSMKARLSLVILPALAITMACLIILAYTAYTGVQKLSAKSAALESRSIQRVEKFGQLQKTLMKISISLRDVVMSSSELNRQDIVATRRKNIDDLSNILEDLRSDATPNQVALFRDLEETIGELFGATTQFDREWQGKFNGPLPSETVASLADRIWSTAVPIRSKVEGIMIELTQVELENQRVLAHSAQSLYKEKRSEIILVVLLSVTLALVASALALSLLQNLVKRMTIIVHSLGHSAESVGSMAVELGESSTQLAASTTEEASSIAETASAMEEMTATISKTVQNVATALDVATEGQHDAKRGREVVGKMIEAMDEIQNSNAKLDKIVKLIEEIQSKTRVINDIVFETRLLSFNASIEAARAGAQGRGFAVVAEEVGNLAVVSGKAADEIRVLLDSTSNEVNEIVRGTQERVSQGRTRAEECQLAFSSMGETLSRVAEFVQSISSAAHEQDSGVKQINRAMAQLDTVTQGNAAAAEELSAQATQLSEDADRLMGSVDQLVRAVFGEQLARIEDVETRDYVVSNRRGFRYERSVDSLDPKVRNPATKGGMHVAVHQKHRRPKSFSHHKMRFSDDLPKESQGEAPEQSDIIDRNDPRWKESA